MSLLKAQFEAGKHNKRMQVNHKQLQETKVVRRVQDYREKLVKVI